MEQGFSSREAYKLYLYDNILCGVFSSSRGPINAALRAYNALCGYDFERMKSENTTRLTLIDNDNKKYYYTCKYNDYGNHIIEQIIEQANGS